MSNGEIIREFSTLAKRGTKPKPSQQHELSGAYDKNPQRRSTNEPVPPEGVPECPEHLNETAKVEWWAMCVILQEMAILSRADRAALEQYCDAYSRWRDACRNVDRYGAVLIQKDGDKVETKRNPFDLVRMQNAQLCAKLLVEFGLTPSSRVRVQANPKKEADKFETFLKTYG